VAESCLALCEHRAFQVAALDGGEEGQAVSPAPALRDNRFATGWIECLAMPYRSEAFVAQHIESISPALPFPLQGLD
jgi:hypothetical protein